MSMNSFNQHMSNTESSPMMFDGGVVIQGNVGNGDGKQVATGSASGPNFGLQVNWSPSPADLGLGLMNLKKKNDNVQVFACKAPTSGPYAGLMNLYDGFNLNCGLIMLM